MAASLSVWPPCGLLKFVFCRYLDRLCSESASPSERRPVRRLNEVGHDRCRRRRRLRLRSARRRTSGGVATSARGVADRIRRAGSSAAALRDGRGSVDRDPTARACGPAAPTVDRGLNADEANRPRRATGRPERRAAYHHQPRREDDEHERDEVRDERRRTRFARGDRARDARFFGSDNPQDRKNMLRLFAV